MYMTIHSTISRSKMCLIFSVAPQAKVYGRSQRSKGYGGRSLRMFLRPQILFFVVFLLSSKMASKSQVCVNNPTIKLLLHKSYLPNGDYEIKATPLLNEFLDSKAIKYTLIQIEHKAMNTCVQIQNQIHQYTFNVCFL